MTSDCAARDDARLELRPVNGHPQVPAERPVQVALTGQFAQLLSGLGIALAIASYQSGTVLLVSAAGAELSVLPRSFNKPMGIAAAGNQLAIATRDELVVLANAPSLAPGFPRAPGRYAQLWLPRRVSFTGEIDLHDIAFTPRGIIGAATRFSCLAVMDDAASFTPFWQPPFISDLLPEDRCHLNGIALDAAGVPRFVTALGAGDSAEAWRAQRATGGGLLSVPEGRVVLDGLCMPHSPRLIDGAAYLLNSGAGEVLRLDPAGGPLQCGVFAVERGSGRVLGSLSISSGAEEISDLAVLRGAGRHGILNHTDNTHRWPCRSRGIGRRRTRQR